MHPSLELFLGRLDDADPAFASPEDFDGPHGGALELFQALGFLAVEPEANPVPSCPHCAEGAPAAVGGRFLCTACRSEVQWRFLSVWRFSHKAFLGWLAGRLGLDAGVRQVEERLWALGRLRGGEVRYECFYRRPGPLSEPGRRTLAAFRSVLVFYGLPPAPEDAGVHGPRLSLLDVLELGTTVEAMPVADLLSRGGEVRFDRHSGALWRGDVLLGEVPFGSKEYYFLECLAVRLDHFVPYPDIKAYVLRRAGSVDETEEATFCQGLKSRIKRKWIPMIDRLVITTNKADGYRLRGYAER